MPQKDAERRRALSKVEPPVTDHTGLETATVDAGGAALASGLGLELGPGTVFGRYVILAPIGRGAMAEVVAAYDPQLDRKIALKLLHPDAVLSTSRKCRQRLLREARAVASLDHANVVTVFDAGTQGDQIFLAMELVDGTDLGRWLAERSTARAASDWREVIRIFADAGRGLQAAHEAGLVHRDFKPDNVLVGRDGRVRVADFGLVLRMGDELERGPESESSSPEKPLTRLGQTPGTPAYMAPEQRRGETVGAAADQYAFCVALWEALYGVRPEPSGASESEAKIPASVPRRLRLALLRGLESKPEDRHASMQALVEILEHMLRPKRRGLISAAVVLTALVATAGWFELRQRRLAVCSGSENRLAGLWDQDQRAKMSEILQRGSESSQDVLASFDRWTEQWVSQHRGACEATRITGEQPEEMLGRRMACLERARSELAARVRVLAEGDASIVVHAEQIADSLPELERCADWVWLRTRKAPPSDPEVLQQVRGLRERLAEVNALTAAGRLDEALVLAERNHIEAEALDWAPMVAETLFYLAHRQQQNGSFEAAVETLEKALIAGDRASDDRLRAEAFRKKAYILGYRLNRGVEAERAVAQARAALERLGGVPSVASAIESTHGVIEFAANRVGSAAEHFERSIEWLSGVPGREVQRAGQLANLAVMYRHLGQVDRYGETLERALELARAHQKPSDPEFIHVLFNYGNALGSQQRNREAVEVLNEVLERRRSALAPDHPDLAESMIALAAQHLELEELELAEPLARHAIEIYDAKVPESNPYRSLARHVLGCVMAKQGHGAEAMLLFKRALQGLEAIVGTESSFLARPLLDQAELDIKEDRAVRALPLLERALGLYPRGPEPYLRSHILFALLQARTALNHPADELDKNLSLLREEIALAGQFGQETAARLEAWLLDENEQVNKQASIEGLIKVQR